MASSTRFAEARDLPALTRIYNHYVTDTAITFDVKPDTAAERRVWLEGFSTDGRHRCWVVEEDEKTLGWACSSRFRGKARCFVDRRIAVEDNRCRLNDGHLDGFVSHGSHRLIAPGTMPRPVTYCVPIAPTRALSRVIPASSRMRNTLSKPVQCEPRK